MNSTIEINLSKLEQLLMLHDITQRDILAKINEGRKRPLTEEDVFRVDIKVSILKKIDKFFKKGLPYYTDPAPLTAKDITMTAKYTIMKDKNATSAVKINLSRLDQLLVLHNITQAEILAQINEGLKHPLTAEDVFRKDIKLSTLKKIDEFFKKGLSYYTDPAPPPQNKQVSVFFRKQNFNQGLTYGDCFRINQVESSINLLSGVSSLANYEIERNLPSYTTSQEPQKVARELRELMDFSNPQLQTKSSGANHAREFLKYFIEKLAEQNVLVIEFIEPHNLREEKRTNWEGMFLAPHYIVIKRQQQSLRREVFTLAHELGHYLLDEEETSSLSQTLHSSRKSLRDIERWCNDFAFHFMVGEITNNADRIFSQNPTIYNQEIMEISKQLNISRLAIYTYFVMNNKISGDTYHKLRQALISEYEKRQQEKKREKEEFERENPGKKSAGGLSRPIHSSLEKDIYRNAYFAGVIEEIDIVRRFNPHKNEIRAGYMDRFLYE